MSYAHRIECERLRHSLIAAQQRIVELEEQSSTWQEQAHLMAVELRRRDAAAVEPVAHIIQDESCFPGMVGHIHVDFTPTCRDVKNNGTVQPLYAAAQPSALPPEIVRNINGLGFYQGRLIFGGAVGWYNQAIADAKALGCKAIKLPEKLKWDYNDGVTKDEVYSFNNAIDACAVSLRKDGFTVEGE